MPSKNKVLSLAFLCLLQFAAFSQTYTFTTAGAIGRYGPIQAQLNAAYLSTNLNSQVTTTNGIQSWTVPATGMYRITSYGAKGGEGFFVTPGPGGAKIQGDFNLVAGQILKVLVGQRGTSEYVGGGGGGSFITDINNLPLLVAGGSGGSAYLSQYSFGMSTTCSGNSGTSGMPGSNGNLSTTVSVGGTMGSGGGTATTYTRAQGSGGGGFSGNGVNGNPSTAGLSFINGGNGGAGISSSGGTAGDGGFGGGGGGDWYDNTGAGGGGGYSGGGGGTHFGCGGGGGSYNTGANPVNTSGVNMGEGYVTFTKISGLNIAQTSSVLCNGQLTAALTASAFGGTAPYSYTWSPSGTIGSAITGLGAGTYTCVATDASLAVFTNTFIVAQPAALAALASHTNPSCFGSTNGAAGITVSGGTAPYTYSWSPAAGSASVLNNLPAGTYSCFVRDANNCPLSETYTLTQPAPLTIFGLASSPSVCYGGTALLIGGGALTYTWSHNVSNGVLFTPTQTATYTLTGTNAAGCTASATAVIVVNSSPTLNISGTPTVCTGNQVTLIASGADTYTWNTLSNTASISIGPILTTVYTVTGSLATGCAAAATKTLTVFNTTSVSAVASNTFLCAGSSVLLYGSGATTYTWTGGVLNNSPFTPAISGPYTVTGTGLCGTASSTIYVVVNNLPLVTASISANPVCASSSVTLSGGGAINYIWTGGITNNSPFTAVASSIYTVTGTDGNNCRSTAIIHLTVQPLPVVTAVFLPGQVCLGSPVTFSAGGATTYTWSNAITNNSQFTPTSTASYTVTGRDLNGCESKAWGFVTVIAVPVLTVTSTSPSVCQGSSVTLSATGANIYTWSHAVINNTSFIPAGTAVYTVNGSNSCFTSSAAIGITLNPLPTVIANSTSTLLCQGATLTLSGAGASTYTWSNGVSNSLPFTVSATTTFTVTGSDLNGCKNTALKTISVNPLPTLSLSSPASSICAGAGITLQAGGADTYTLTTGTPGIPIFPATTTTYSLSGTNLLTGCSSYNTAAKTITVYALPVITTGSGTAICSGASVALTASGADTYTWTNGILNNVPFTPAASNAYQASGTSTLTGCTGSAVSAFQLTVNPLPNYTLSNSTPSICSGNTVSLLASGNFSFSWSDGITNGQAFTPTLTSTYTVVGTNTLSGCSSSSTQVITVNPTPTLTIASSATAVCAGSTVSLHASGADSYSWTDNVINNASFVPVTTKTYVVTGTNTPGNCISTAFVQVIVNPLPHITAVASATALCNGSTVIINAQGANFYTASGGIPVNSVFQPSLTTSYSISGTSTVTGCTSTLTLVSILVNPTPAVLISSSHPQLCAGESATLEASGAGTYNWNTSEVTPSIVTIPSATAIYFVTGTDLNGCSATATFTQVVSECLGIQNSSLTAFVVFPNPSNGNFFIKTGTDLKLQVINETGQLLRSIEAIKDSEIQVRDLPDGIYFLIGKKHNQVIKTKVVVNR